MCYANRLTLLNVINAPAGGAAEKRSPTSWKFSIDLLSRVFKNFHDPYTNIHTHSSSSMRMTGSPRPSLGRCQRPRMTLLLPLTSSEGPESSSWPHQQLLLNHQSCSCVFASLLMRSQTRSCRGNTLSVKLVSEHSCFPGPRSLRTKRWHCFHLRWTLRCVTCCFRFLARLSRSSEWSFLKPNHPPATHLCTLHF